MKYLILSTYDSATEMYNQPFHVQSIGQATREFTDVLSDPNHPMAKHPEDYALFQIGTFNDNTGKIEPIEPKCVARAHELIALQKAKQEAQ